MREGPRTQENIERGRNVRIELKFIRHGERDKDGNLLDYGRQITREKADESGIHAGYFDAVKALGSDAGPKGPGGMQRSLETADIYAHEIEGDDAFTTRVEKLLSYEGMISEAPYDHKAVYDSLLPENFDELSPEEKKEAAKVAQKETTNHLASLKTPEAMQYKREIAGALAKIVLHHMEMARRLKSGSNVLRPAGTHGGTMEYLLQQGLVMKGEGGRETTGFDSFDVIGGEFDPSEAYNVTIETDASGEFEALQVSFDNPSRPQGEMTIDLEKVKELAEAYDTLHAQK